MTEIRQRAQVWWQDGVRRWWIVASAAFAILANLDTIVGWLGIEELLGVRALLSRVGARTWFELWLLFTIAVLLESVWRVARSRDAANRQLERNRRNQELSDLLSDRHEYGVHELLNKQPKTDDEFAAWLKAEDDWLKGVLAIMREHGCTKQQIRHVHTLGIIQMIPLHPEPRVSHQLSMLATRLTRIADIAREYGE
jgi:hypothetical protein